jgi:hypothetical protein
MLNPLRLTARILTGSWHGCLVIVASVWVVSVPLLGQDDSGAPPPPSDYSQAPPASDTNSASDNGSQAPDDSVSFQTFYDDLAGQGTWIQSSDYGYVWQPQETDADWAPYTEGHWVYTDDGWTWVSDEPWGWATYHYGRWVNLDGVGWCWVPGYTWAPAWVSWRYGDGYAGWAPLPPDSFDGVDYSDDGSEIGIGFHIGGDCDDFYGIGAGWYNFLPINCLGYRSYHGYYRNRGDNYSLINHTTNVTNINVTRSGAAGGRAGTFGHVSAGGPMLAQVNAVSQTPVQRVSLVRAGQPDGGGALSGNSLALYAPRVDTGTTGQPQRVASSIGQPAINRGTDIMHPLAVNARLTGTPATESQVQAARVAEANVPTGAKVLTDGTSVRSVMQGPLTSMRPVTREQDEAPTRTFESSPGVVPNTERAPSSAAYPQTVYPGANPGGVSPSRIYAPGTVYPSGGTPSYEQHAITSPVGGGTETHSFARPTAPAESHVAPSTAPVVHEGEGTTGGRSGGTVPSGGGSAGAPAGGSAGGGYSGGGGQRGH